MGTGESGNGHGQGKADAPGRTRKVVPVKVFKPIQRPWFVAKSVPGKLFQAWMILFFLLTWAVVKKYIFAGPNLMGPLPTPLFGIWLLDLCTVLVLFVVYYKHYKGVAERGDEKRKQLEGRGAEDPEGSRI